MLAWFGAALMSLAGAQTPSPPRIEWVDCAKFAKVDAGVKAECGYLRTREQRANPKSRIIGVPFAIVRNPRRTDDDAPIFIFTGGPGNRGIPRMLRAVDLEFGGSDKIFFEQRGTALADPVLACPGYAEERQRAQRGEIDGAALDRGLIAIAARCVADARKAGADLSGYTTKAIVEDVEELRILLGAPRINLIGLSYTGKVVSEYARDYPASTRAVVANTPLPVEANYDETGSKAMRESLDMVFAGCARNTACDAAYPALGASFARIMEQAARDPWSLALPDPDRTGETRTVRATPWVVANALLDQLYDGGTIAQLPKRIAAIAGGDKAALTEIVDIGKSSYPWLMRMAIWCNEEVPFQNAAHIARDQAAYPEFGGVSQTTVPPGLCRQAGLTASPPASENMAVRSNAPFLIFSGGFDPATPPHLQRDMAKTLPNATIALFPALGHGAGFSRCGGQILEAFLKDPLQKPDLRCTAEYAAPDFVH